MPTRAKARRTSPRRRTPVVTSRPVRAGRRTKAGRAHLPHKQKPTPTRDSRRNPDAVTHAPSNGYSKALRFLAKLTDFERLRIVRYTTQNFDLERMRTLLRRLGNPQDHFKSAHV